MPAILLKTPCRLSSMSTNEDIEANTFLGFVYNRTQLSVHFSAPIKTSCSRNLCDLQRVNDCLGTKGCGFYGMSPNSTSLAIQHTINIKIGTNDDLNMCNFSSLKFLQLYLSGDITGSCKLYMIQLTEAGINMFNTIDSCINFINSHGGFTVIGW